MDVGPPNVNGTLTPEEAEEKKRTYDIMRARIREMERADAQMVENHKLKLELEAKIREGELARQALAALERATPNPNIRAITQREHKSPTLAPSTSRIEEVQPTSSTTPQAKDDPFRNTPNLSQEQQRQGQQQQRLDSIQAFQNQPQASTSHAPASTSRPFSYQPAPHFQQEAYYRETLSSGQFRQEYSHLPNLNAQHSHAQAAPPHSQQTSGNTGYQPHGSYPYTYAPYGAPLAQSTSSQASHTSSTSVPQVRTTAPPLPGRARTQHAGVNVTQNGNSFGQVFFSVPLNPPPVVNVPSINPLPANPGPGGSTFSTPPHLQEAKPSDPRWVEQIASWLWIDNKDIAVAGMEDAIRQLIFTWATTARINTYFDLPGGLYRVVKSAEGRLFVQTSQQKGDEQLDIDTFITGPIRLSMQNNWHAVRAQRQGTTVPFPSQQPTAPNVTARPQAQPLPQPQQPAHPQSQPQYHQPQYYQQPHPHQQPQPQQPPQPQPQPPQPPQPQPQPHQPQHYRQLQHQPQPQSHQQPQHYQQPQPSQPQHPSQQLATQHRIDPPIGGQQRASAANAVALQPQSSASSTIPSQSHPTPPSITPHPMARPTLFTRQPLQRPRPGVSVGSSVPAAPAMKFGPPSAQNHQSQNISTVKRPQSRVTTEPTDRFRPYVSAATTSTATLPHVPTPPPAPPPAPVAPAAPAVTARLASSSFAMWPQNQVPDDPLLAHAAARAASSGNRRHSLAANVFKSALQPSNGPPTPRRPSDANIKSLARDIMFALGKRKRDDQDDAMDVVVDGGVAGTGAHTDSGQSAPKKQAGTELDSSANPSGPSPESTQQSTAPTQNPPAPENTPPNVPDTLSRVPTITAPPGVTQPAPSNDPIPALVVTPDATQTVLSKPPPQPTQAAPPPPLPRSSSPLVPPIAVLDDTDEDSRPPSPVGLSNQLPKPRPVKTSQLQHTVTQPPVESLPSNQRIPPPPSVNAASTYSSGPSKQSMPWSPPRFSMVPVGAKPSHPLHSPRPPVSLPTSTVPVTTPSTAQTKAVLNSNPNPGTSPARDKTPTADELFSEFVTIPQEDDAPLPSLSTPTVPTTASTVHFGISTGTMAEQATVAGPSSASTSTRTIKDGLLPLTATATSSPNQPPPPSSPSSRPPNSFSSKGTSASDSKAFPVEPLFLPSDTSSSERNSPASTQPPAQAMFIDLTEDDVIVPETPPGGDANHQSRVDKEEDIVILEHRPAPTAKALGKRPAQSVYVLVPPAPEYVESWKRSGKKSVPAKYFEVVSVAGSSRGRGSGNVSASASARSSRAPSSAFAEEDFSFWLDDHSESQTNPFERETVHLACSRLQQAPCKWDGCDVVMNTVHGLIYHLNQDHKPQGGGGPIRGADKQHFLCKWTQCGRRVKISEKHLETHASVPLRCLYQDCEHTFRTPAQLAKHRKNKHEGGALKPDGRPVTIQRDGPLQDPPNEDGLPDEPVPVFPAFAPVLPCGISKERHEWHGRNTMPRIGGLNEEGYHLQFSRPRKAGKPPNTEEVDAEAIRKTYEFLNIRSTRYSSYLSTGVDDVFADVPNAADLTELCVEANGEVELEYENSESEGEHSDEEGC